MYKVILHLFQFQDFFDKVQTELADLLVPNHPFPIIEYNTNTTKPGINTVVNNIRLFPKNFASSFFMIIKISYFMIASYFLFFFHILQKTPLQLNVSPESFLYNYYNKQDVHQPLSPLCLLTYLQYQKYV